MTAEETRARLEAANFQVIAWQDTSTPTIEFARRRAQAAASPLGIHVIMGPDWPAMTANLVRNLAEDRVRAIEAVLEQV